MPPKKESAAQRKAREKAERFAAAQLQERLDFEADEERARGQAELLERVARTDAMLHFYETLVQPSSRLMVPHTAYERIRARMQEEGAVSAQRLLAMQLDLRRQEKGGEQLQLELAHLRSEVRGIVASARQSLDDVRRNVDAKLGGFVDALEGAVLNQRSDAAACGAALNQALAESRERHVRVALDAQRRAMEMTELWREATSLHTRIPPRIRRTLQRLEKDDLLLILDTLSFESVVRRYLLYRFAPGPDDPFADDPELGSSSIAEAPPAGIDGTAPYRAQTDFRTGAVDRNGAPVAKFSPEGGHHLARHAADGILAAAPDSEEL